MPVKFWKFGLTTPSGMPVSRIAARSARGLPDATSACQVRERARVEHRAAASRARGAARRRRTGCRSNGESLVPVVLALHRDEHLVEQRVAETRHLRPRPDVRRVVPVVAALVVEVHALTRCRRPHADHRERLLRVGRRVAVGRQQRHRDLQRDRVHVEILRRVHRHRAARHRDEVRALDRPERAEVEDRSEVDVEALGPLPGEHLRCRRRASGSPTSASAA